MICDSPGFKITSICIDVHYITHYQKVYRYFYSQAWLRCPSPWSQGLVWGEEQAGSHPPLERRYESFESLSAGSLSHETKWQNNPSVRQAVKFSQKHKQPWVAYLIITPPPPRWLVLSYPESSPSPHISWFRWQSASGRSWHSGWAETRGSVTGEASWKPQHQSMCEKNTPHSTWHLHQSV